MDLNYKQCNCFFCGNIVPNNSIGDALLLSTFSCTSEQASEVAKEILSKNPTQEDHANAVRILGGQEDAYPICSTYSGCNMAKRIASIRKNVKRKNSSEGKTANKKRMSVVNEVRCIIFHNKCLTFKFLLFFIYVYIK